MRKLHWSLLKRIYRLRGRFNVYSRLKRHWLLDSHNWVDQQLIIRRPYEVDQIRRCREYIREHGLNYFFDMGANFGLYSILLAEEAGLTHIHAFEPLPRNAHQFFANLYLNDLDYRVRLHSCALSDRSGQLDLFVDPNSTGVSTLLPFEKRSRAEAYQATVRVVSKVFDEEFSFTGIRAMVKMDVEGAELMVLAGMRRFLSDNRIVMQVETTPQTIDQVDGLMREADFRLLGRLDADSYFGNI